MILTVDIGNTNITIGLFLEDKLLIKESLPTSEAREFSVFLRRRLKPKGGIEKALVCSVVPKLNPAIKKALSSALGIPIYVLGQDLIVPIKNLYSRAKQAGQDRLACAYMAMKLYGAPVISIDLGTAITFDAVSKDGEYLGGIIVPGLKLSLSALHHYTALLPQVRLRQPRSLIGRDTKASMLSGITFGYGRLIDGLVECLQKELGNNAKAVATGGDSLLIKRYCKKVDYFDPDLILKGMAKLYEECDPIA